MLSNDFFHPDHVIPATEFVTAVMEQPHSLKAKMGMELLTVFAKIFIFCLGITNACVQIQDPHFF